MKNALAVLCCCVAGLAYGSEAGNAPGGLIDAVTVTEGRCSNCDVPFQLGRIHFVSEKSGWSSAYYLPSGNGSGRSTILSTRDGGRHWKAFSSVRQQSAEEEPPFFLLDMKHSWLAFFDSETAEGEIWRTRDGGLSWTRNPSRPLTALQFLDEFHGYSAGADLSGAFFQRTSDGGSTWDSSEISLSHIEEMTFVDQHNGIIAGTKTTASGAAFAILVTHDGGLRWTEAALPHREVGGRSRNLVWIDTTNALLTLWRANDQGSVVLMTSNGGETWMQHPDQTFQGTEKFVTALVFGRNRDGYLFYDDRSTGRHFVAASTDGGQTWNSKEFPMSVTACHALRHTILCGSGLKLLRFQK